MHLLDSRGHKRLLGIEQVVPVRFDTVSLRAINSHEHIRMVDRDLAWTWKGVRQMLKKLSMRRTCADKVPVLVL